MRAGSSPSPVEPRLRLSTSLERKALRDRTLRGVEKDLNFPVQYRNLKCKISYLKLVLVIIALGTLVTLFHSPVVYTADHLSITGSRPSFVDLWARDGASVDPRYISTAEVDWDQISNTIENLNDSNEYQGIGLLNFNDSEIDNWKQLLPDIDHVVLQLDHMAKNITWESLYSEWIDEEEEFGVPTCPFLPRITFPGKPRLDLIAVKLPCNIAGTWSRDVARLHLQLAAASLAASGKSYHPVRVLLVTDCFPTPNLFICKELILHKGNMWLYQPNFNTLGGKATTPSRIM